MPKLHQEEISMSTSSDILIYRDFPVVNGYVQVPPNGPADKHRVTLENALVAFAGSASEVDLTLGSGRETGSHFGQQKFLRLAPIHPDTWYRAGSAAIDPVTVLHTPGKQVTITDG